ncbi:glutathione synthetase-like [Lineus longissimus]|uniref:glutathione synthetase-like n=1 Tax=Lineus longissimus TaxID=88925 RepID=UPI002B4CB475
MDKDIQTTLLEISKESLDELVGFVKGYAVVHGIITCRVTPESPNLPVISPFAMTLLPSPFKRNLFILANELQSAYNLMYHRIAQDYDFLNEAFREIRKSDDFLQRLFEIYELVRNESGAPPISLEISRSDYMVDGPIGSTQMIKQIEYNTIACGMVVFAPGMYDCHRSTLTKLRKGELVKNMPSNGALVGWARSIVTAWKMYGSEEAMCLMVVEPVESNIYEIRRLEYCLQETEPKIRVKMLTLREISEKAQLTDDLRLFIDGIEVALVYFRTGYVPKCYPTKKEWEARTMVERSTAIKCPTVQYQLAGFKRVQQILCEPGVVERYIKDPDTAAKLRKTFARQYSLQDDDGDSAIQLALTNPENYVLKPQREGGGNNLFDGDIPKCLAKVKGTPTQNEYILMERVKPTAFSGSIMRPGRAINSEELVSELGIFGVLISNGDEIVQNEGFGHAMRTNRVNATEVGIMSALGGGVDSPYLID